MGLVYNRKQFEITHKGQKMKADKVMLITWQCEGSNAEKVIQNKIAAVLPIRSADDFVERVMKLIYFNQHTQGKQRLYLETQLQGLKELGGIKRNRMRVNTSRFGIKSYSSSNPWLKAREAFNYKVIVKQSKTAPYCIASWEELIEPSTLGLSDLEIQKLLPLKKRKMQYDTRTNLITMGK